MEYKITMISLEDILELFYGKKNKMLHIFNYLCIDTLIALIKTSKYFYQYKTFLYQLVIGQLRCFKGITYPYSLHYPKQIKTPIIIRTLERIRENNVLNKKKYMVQMYERVVHVRLTE